MSRYRVFKWGRYFVKLDGVTMYPVLVVARTVKNSHIPIRMNFLIKLDFQNFQAACFG